MTLHLPPESDVTAPETVTVCRQPDCASGTLPPALAAGYVALVTTTRPEVGGGITLGPGDIRVLDLTWTLQPGDVNQADPRNAYLVTVTDATGAETGAVSGEVTYAHAEDCGAAIWTGHLSD